MRSIEKRLEKLEEPLKPKSIFADWCMAKDPDWNGTDSEAFDQWLSFIITATPEEMDNKVLNPPVGDIADLHSKRF